MNVGRVAFAPPPPAVVRLPVLPSSGNLREKSQEQGAILCERCQDAYPGRLMLTGKARKEDGAVVLLAWCSEKCRARWLDGWEAVRSLEPEDFAEMLA